MSDEEIVLLLKKGKSKYIENLIDKYYKYLSVIIYNVGNKQFSNEDIEEMVSDCFLKFWLNIQRFDYHRENEGVRKYLAVMARNLALNSLAVRKNNVINLNENVAVDDGGGGEFENAFERKEISFEVKKRILEMDDPDKTILLYRFFYYLKAREIASILGMNQKTVETKLLRGKVKLKKILEERGVCL